MLASRRRKAAAACLLVATVAGAGAAARIYWFSLEPGHHLTVKLEGAVNERNFRDFGASFNACLGAEWMRPNRVFRAAAWFSGFACSGVGDPDVLYSLNFKPDDGREYYCHAPDGNRIGRHLNTHAELKDLEFLQTWDDPGQREDACAFLRDSYGAIASGKRVLVHCDAGRDRTGTYAALLEALVAERRAALDPRVLQAIECDYRKTASLAPAKQGRMAAFLSAAAARDGSVHGFLGRECGLDTAALDAAAEAVSWPIGQSPVK